MPSGIYKAFITLGGGESLNINRYACSTANCSGESNTSFDWVLQPDTYYYISGDLAFKTNESSIFITSLSTKTDNSYLYWSGFNRANDWTSPSVNSSENCSGWTTRSAGSQHQGVLGWLHPTKTQLTAGT